jgi:hypothetical protein
VQSVHLWHPLAICAMAPHSLKKTWFLVPSWDIPPSAIRLGYLIADPTEPRYPLNPVPVSPMSGVTFDAPIIDTEVFVDTDHDGFSMHISGGSSTNFGIWARFLHHIGIAANVKLILSTEASNRWVVEQAQTEWFSPSSSFVRSSIKTKDVVDFLDMAGLQKPLYMITGVKTVTGASLSSSLIKGRSYGAKVGIGEIPTWASLSAGPELECRVNQNEAIEFKKKGPIVFAYQLVKVNLKDANAKAGPVFKGAMFGAGESEPGLIETDISEELPGFLLNGVKSGVKQVALVESFDESTKEKCALIIPGGAGEDEFNA